MSKKDGGPAFPARIPLVHDADQGKDYPNYDESGMSLRDWFAGQALNGLLAGDRQTGWGLPERAAERSYALADAMIAEREK